LNWSLQLSPDNFSQIPLSDSTLSIEREHRHTLQELETLRETILAMEHTLGVEHQWTPQCDEWKATQQQLDMRNYTRALDNLEALVVARLFEMTKMNMSGTGASLLRLHVISYVIN
jgi:hypothetical protein